MRTEDLIEFLSTGVSPVPSGVAGRRFSAALLFAVPVSFLLMILIFGLRPHLAVVARTGLFWEKLIFPVCIMLGALIATVRLARPGAAIGVATWPLIAVPVILVWIAGITIIGTAAPQDRLALVLGHTWRSCPFNILLLSVPGFIAVLQAAKGLAPTRLRCAGAACGLLGGSIGTVMYCFHCPEMSPAFWSIWYVLGMTLPTTIGALLGPRLLRW
jgi:hypothetical protein